MGNQEKPHRIELLDEQDCHYPELLAGNDVLRRCSQVPANGPDEDRDGTCFVHIRMGDYSSFIVGGGPVEIPVSWYEEQMAVLRKSHPGIAFRVYSDEPAKVRERLSIQADTELIEADTNQSFVGMARCGMGILSASTFSWWAAAVAHSAGASGPFVAPAGWENWRLGVFSDSTKMTPWLSYVGVTT